MPQISISELRREILRTAGLEPASGAASTAAIGTLFHQTLALLMGPQGWPAALEPDELNDSSRLLKYTYEKLLGPRLAGMQAALRDNGAEIIALWHATGTMCAWLCRVLRDAVERKVIRYDRGTRAWIGAEELCRPEQPLEWEVCLSHWTAPVLVTGVADALLRDPVSGRWCLLEFKLGQGQPLADLAQACLYHAMLTASGLAPSDGALAVFSFRPELRERFYSSADLAVAFDPLRDLIGRLAGVVQNARPQASTIRIPAEPISSQPSPKHSELGRRMVEAFRNYGVAIEWDGRIVAGPTFLRFPVTPGRNVRKKAVTEKAGELQMQLKLEEPPFINLERGQLVIDVQRPDREIVPFSSLVDQLPAPAPGGISLVPLGIDLNREVKFADLASPNNPHLLVAGTSGSGKSEWLRTAIAGLIVSNSPEDLRFVLIDPKRTAFTELKNSPYLFGQRALVYPPDDSAEEVLGALIEEMENRYRLFSAASASDLPEFTAKTGRNLARIVCVCDEYADLISDRLARKNIEACIQRLGSKARAAGIHLIVATQYPDRNTVGGALKANLGGRVCLRTTNHIQSYMIINQSGAERLLGKGDLFFLSIGEPIRLQAPCLSSEDRSRIFGRN